jgi:hypothetical protein
MAKNFEGGCLCGAVRYASNAAPVAGAHCYCVDCRKASGTGHGSHVILSADALCIEGEVRYYDAPADSGNIVSRGFCPACGSAIVSTNSAMPGMAFIRASSLDDPEVFKPAIAVFIARAPSWDPVDSGLPSFEGMPPPEAMPI